MVTQKKVHVKDHRAISRNGYPGGSGGGGRAGGAGGAGRAGGVIDHEL